MGAAGTIWDAAKHPRSYHGRFGSGTGMRVAKAPGKAPRKAASDESKRLLSGYTMGSATTRAFLSKGNRARTTVTQFEPGVASTKHGIADARVRYVFSRGRHGPVTPHPRGGTYRPLVEPAGFKPVGYQLQEPGYYRDVQARKKDPAKRARHLMAQVRRPN